MKIRYRHRERRKRIARTQKKLTKLANKQIIVALLQSIMQNNTIDEANDVIKLLNTKICKKLNCIFSYEIDL